MLSIYERRWVQGVAPRLPSSKWSESQYKMRYYLDVLSHADALIYIFMLIYVNVSA